MRNKFLIKIKESLLFHSFSLFYRVAVKKKKFETDKSDEVKKILIVRFGGIGYSLSITPLINLLKDELNCTIFLLVDKRGSFVFRNNPAIGNLVIYTEGFKNIVEILKQIKYEKFDAVINTHYEYSPLIEFFMIYSDIQLKYGFTHKYHRSYSASINYDFSMNDNLARNFLRLGTLLGFNEIDNRNITYTPVHTNFEKTKHFLETKFSDKKFVIGINISTGMESNSWNKNSYFDLITELTKYNVNILILSTTRDLNKALEISENKVTVFYTPSFDEFAAMVSQINLLVSPECSTILLSSVFNIPVAGIYTKIPDNEPVWKPIQKNALIIQKNVTDINHISSNEVISELKPFLDSILKKYYETN